MTMKNPIVLRYFKMITRLLVGLGAIPEHIELRKKSHTYLLNHVYPVMLLLYCIPPASMATYKVKLLLDRSALYEMFDMFHMYFFGMYTFYMMICAQRTCKHFKNCMRTVEMSFVACEGFALINFSMVMFLVVAEACAFTFYGGGCIYYNQVLMPMHIPYIDTEGEELTPTSLVINWIFSVSGCTFVILMTSIIAPFVVVVTKLILWEMGYLIKQCELFEYVDEERACSLAHGGIFLTDLDRSQINYLNPICVSEECTKRFIVDFVTHHEILRSVIDEVKKMHDHFFLTQVLFTIMHSCFLVFHLYYTDNPTKAVVKSSPFLLVSYYLLFIYCWNGQILSDKCEELHRALYRGRWYNAPKSFKTSLMIIQEYCRRPVKLTGGGIFEASFKTFLTGVEQSISYVLILKQLTRNGDK